MLVMKFGGSSVANRSQIEKVQRIVEARRDRAPLVVCSAHKGMTDALINAARAATRGERSAKAVIDKQQAIAEELGCPADLLEPFFREIRELLRGISLVKELSPRSLDYIASFGERMSVRCIADFFSRHGLPAKAFDAWDLGFITNADFGSAWPVADYEERVRAAYREHVDPSVVPVVTGFVGKTTSGEITTVGRNGSDLTATLLAAALRADEAQIWTDTDGVMTADPSVVVAARNIPIMRFDEAAELAYFGSRVLHPSTLIPAIERRIPVRVLNTNRPEHPGTVIQEELPDGLHGVTSIAYKENQVVCTLTSTRMFGESGYLGEVFGVLARHKVIVDMIATSEVSISFTSNHDQALPQIIAELERFGSVSVKYDKTILAVVGLALSKSPGIGSRIMGAVAEAGVNIEMLSYGMNSINFVMLIDDEDIHKAVSKLHAELFDQSAMR